MAAAAAAIPRTRVRPRVVRVRRSSSLQIGALLTTGIVVPREKAPLLAARGLPSVDLLA